MEPIKLPSASVNFSIRINEELLKEIDDVTIELKQLTENGVSRNQLIELMLQFAAENASFSVDGEEISFKILLNTFRAQNLLFPEMLPSSDELGKEI